MFRQATKDRGEREDEAAEHLVRPAPKKKPPRRDLRRERVDDAASDPDLKSDLGVEHDPDMSLNRKRTAVQQVLALSKDDRVPAKDKDDKIVYVSERTLREKSDKYTKLSPEEAEEAEQEKVKPDPEKAQGKKTKAQPGKAEKPTKAQPVRPEGPKNQGLAAPPESYSGPLMSVFNTTTQRVEFHTWDALVNNPGKLIQSPGIEVPKGAKPGQPYQRPGTPTQPSVGQATPEKPSKATPVEAPEKPSKAPKPTVPTRAQPAPPQAQQEAPEQPEPQAQPAAQPSAEKAQSEKPEETSKPEKGRPEKPSAAKPEKVKKEPKPETDAGKAKEALAAKHSKALGVLAKSNPEVKRLLKDLGNPTSSANKVLKSKGDLSRLSVAEAFPELKDLAGDKDFTSAQDVVDAAKQMYGTGTSKGSKKKPLNREVGIEERLEVERRAFDSLPTKMASELIRQGVHPDDLAHIIEEYEKSERMDPADRRKYIAEARREGVSFDKDSLRAPDNYNGTPWAELSEEERSDAMAEVRRETLTRSYIAREFAVESLNDAGVPADLSYEIANVHLGVVPPDQRDAITEHISEKTFEKSIGTKTTVDPQSRAKLIRMVKDDPDTSSIITNYLQACDYNVAKKQFAKSLDERAPAHAIVKSVREAMDFLKEQSKDYPSSLTAHDMAKAYKLRVLDKLRSLDPEKYEEVQHSLSSKEAKEYRTLLRDHDSRLKVWESGMQEWTKKRDDYQKHVQENEAAIKAWVEAGKPDDFKLPHESLEPPGKPPVQPELGIAPPGMTPEAKERWEKAHKDTEERTRKYFEDEESEVEAVGKRLQGEAKPVDAEDPDESEDNDEADDDDDDDPDGPDLEGTVWAPPKKPGKGKQSSVFTYAVRKVMRTAVYHGVDPYPYPPEKSEWTQARRQELTDADHKVILAEARNWLKSGPLSQGFDGAPRDAQLRAALDLGIRQAGGGRYSEGIPPVDYESMFRQLANVGSEGTLLTVQSSYISPGTSPNGDHANMSMPKFAATQANNLLSRLDRVASLVQENHQKWGIPFKAAKEIVNALDKTADEIEIASFGQESFQKRQAEVIMRDQDESYMDTFQNPMKPIQTDGDEKYMSAYGDDQSSAVDNGKSTTGRPLAP